MTQRKMKTRKMTAVEKLMMTQVETEYVYLLQTREFLNSKEPVYKIGRSKQDNYSRFSQYGLGSVLLFQSSCCDSIKLEKEIIDLFNDKYERIKILGNEWFRGNANEMKADLCDIIKNSITENNDTISILDAFVEVCLQQEMLQYLVEECTQQYLVEEENIVEKFIEETIQDVIVEETIQDIFDEENVSGSVVENEDYECVLLDDEEVVVEDEDEVVEVGTGNEIVKNLKFSCFKCQFSTDTNGHLKQHFATEKCKRRVENIGVIVFPYKCCKCERVYQTKSGLQKHKSVCKAPDVVVPIAPEIVDILHAKIDNLERMVIDMAKK